VGGLCRVFDNRFPRYCPDEAKFPLGWWKRGELRVYDIVCDKRKRHIEVTITKLNSDMTAFPIRWSFFGSWMTVQNGGATITNLLPRQGPGGGVTSN
jgi:hypothetical protein